MALGLQRAGNDIASVISRVRRAMPRNADVMLLCDRVEAAERATLFKTDRKTYFREYMRRYRREKKGTAK